MLTKIKTTLFQVLAWGVLLVLVPVASFATTASPIQMIHVTDPKVDLQVKIETILNAKKTLDVITYHHDNSPESVLFMESLRQAARRGVKVRYIYDKVASSSAGNKDLSDTYLDLLKKDGVQIRALGIKDRLTKWGPFKIIHSKCILADAGDEHQIMVTGGRNLGAKYMSWLDNAFVLRFKTHSALDEELKEYFERAWSLLKEAKTSTKKEITESLTISERNLKDTSQYLLGNDGTAAQIQDFKSFLKTGEAKEIPHFVMTSSEVQFVSSGLIEKMGGDKADNEILSATNQILKDSHKVQVSTIFFDLSKDQRTPIEAYLKKGGRLEILTNQSQSFADSLSQEKPGFLPRALGKIQNQEFKSLAGDGKLVIKLFKGDSATNFTHGKFIIGDSGAVLITTSNSNSTADKNSEDLGFVIRNPDFSKYLSHYTDKISTTLFEDGFVKHDEKLTLTEKSCAAVLKNIF